MIGVGIDVGKAFLDLARHDLASSERFHNSRSGILRLVERLRQWKEAFVVIEATGGFEMPLLDSLVHEGFPVARVNPRQARNFARAQGQLAKTDAIDARVLADMAACLHHKLNRFRPPSPWQRNLAAFVTRRAQVVLAIQQQTQQLQSLAIPELQTLARRSIRTLRAELLILDKRIAELASPHLSRAWRSIKGLGPVVQATLMSLLPELGSLSRQQIAKLVGVAPLNRDSGTLRGHRGIFGGRPQVRSTLYMATLVAIRWQPEFKDHYQQLRQRGKVAKVAIVACMRKFVVILNARIREERLNTDLSAP
jgi:transposase